MKITVVVHNLNGGGAEKMMVRLANGLANLGQNVSIVLLTEGGVNIKNVSERVTLHELKAHRTVTAIPKLRQHLLDSKPDKILSALTHVNVIAILACLSIGRLKSLYVSERNAFSKDKLVNNDFLVKIAYFLAPFFYRFIPNPVFAVSDGVAQDLIKTTVVNRASVINLPNPTLDDDFRTKEFSKPTHPWLADKTTPIIVGLGRLAAQKGFDDLINAVAIVKQSMDVRLIIYGEGELRAALQKQVDELGLTQSVSLFGYTEAPLDEIHAADVFVLSSLFEGSPNALVEAMGAQCKVVSTRCPCGPDEVLEDGVVGSLVPVKSPEKLAEAIYSTLVDNNYDIEKQLNLAEKYTVSNSAKSYLKAME